MRKLRIYADTSVYGGAMDEEFSGASRRFFERVRAGEFTILVSQLVTDELGDAPSAVRAVVTSLPASQVLEVRISNEVRELAEAYLAEGILGDASRQDATHVAAATVAEADLILSWNFRHLVRYDNIRLFNGINALHGYPAIDIRSPLELMNYGDENRQEDV